MVRKLTIYALLLIATAGSAQTLASHEVNSNNSITFRYADLSAKTVMVSTDAVPEPLALVRGANGIWSATTPVLPPEIYSYSFVVDGVSTLDPTNDAVRANYVEGTDNVLVPGNPSSPWQLTNIPHGRVDHHIFTTNVVQRLPEAQSDYFVYTPPGYDEHRPGGYPVLYLLHGWSDYASGWIDVGKANLMLDSMIASGQAVPMIVVMPLGYGDLEFVQHGYSAAWDHPAAIDNNFKLFSRSLETEVMPRVEKQYNIAPGRDSHAIVGLSMGGLESLYVGLNHTDQFAWVGGMSAAILQRHFHDHLPNLDARKANLRLLWVACGTSDGFLAPNRDFVSWAKAKGLDVTAVETPGQHTWLVWRDNLLHFAPLLFRNK